MLNLQVRCDFEESFAERTFTECKLAKFDEEELLRGRSSPVTGSESGMNFLPAQGLCCAALP
jgi:hypothetical protein